MRGGGSGREHELQLSLSLSPKNKKNPGAMEPSEVDLQNPRGVSSLSLSLSGERWGGSVSWRRETRCFSTHTHTRLNIKACAVRASEWSVEAQLCRCVAGLRCDILRYAGSPARGFSDRVQIASRYESSWSGCGLRLHALLLHKRVIMQCFFSDSCY